MTHLTNAQFHHYAAFWLAPAHAERFLAVFRRLEAGGWSFNLSAAFWSVFWFFYHKMYAVGWLSVAVYYGSDWLIDRGLAALGANPHWLVGLVHLALMAALIGGLADRFYYRWCRATIERLWHRHHAALGEDGFIDLLVRRGGVNLSRILWVLGGFVGGVAALMLWLYTSDPALFYRALLAALEGAH
jgi:hypothetical protein